MAKRSATLVQWPSAPLNERVATTSFQPKTQTSWHSGSKPATGRTLWTSSQPKFVPITLPPTATREIFRTSFLDCHWGEFSRRLLYQHWIFCQVFLLMWYIMLELLTSRSSFWGIYHKLPNYAHFGEPFWLRPLVESSNRSTKFYRGKISIQNFNAILILIMKNGSIRRAGEAHELFLE